MENRNFSAFSTYTVRDFYLMEYVPTILQYPVKNRFSSTFLYIVKGQYAYTGKNINFYANAGDMIFAPKGASYTYSVLTKSTHCIQINFDIYDGNEKPFLLSDTPTVVTSPSFAKMFDSILKHYYAKRDMAVLADFYRIADHFGTVSKERFFRDRMSRIRPAVSYIQQHFREPIYVAELAAMCAMSESHLRRLFGEHLGVSPIQYKTKLLSEAARNLIRNEGMSVGDVAYSLQFNDVYAFSQFFKKCNGISPTRYAKTVRNAPSSENSSF